MALGADIKAHDIKPDLRHVHPTQLTGQWAQILDAGALDDVDANILRPSAADGATKHVYKCPLGTTLLLRMRYTDNAITQELKVRVYGRKEGDSSWMSLMNRVAAVEIEISTDNGAAAETDMEIDGTTSVTAVHPNRHCCDLMGCNEVLVLVAQDFQATGEAAAVLEAKVI